MRTFESGRYIWRFRTASEVAEIRKDPPRFESRIEPKMKGESKCGRQSQSIVPSRATSATVCRSPMTP